MIKSPSAVRSSSEIARPSQSAPPKSTPNGRIRQLRQVPAEELPGYLRTHSDLPGPRANLELADAFTVVADRATILGFADSDDEYLRLCGTQAIGTLILGDRTLTGLLRARAQDSSRCVREATARALQLVGDMDRQHLRTIVTDWIKDNNPDVRRAALAAICEPRLLTDRSTKIAALNACADASRSIARLPTARRTEEPVRRLRQALGYCWSVAVAADPQLGLPAFNRLGATDDPDMSWIVAANRGKARLVRVIQLSHQPGCP